MKKILLSLLLLSSIGCRGLNRLMDGSEGTPPPPPKLISSLAPIDATAPLFDLPIPNGYTRTIFWGALPANGEIQITMNSNSLVDVMMEQRTIGQWTKLGIVEIPAFWYTYDSTKGIVTIHGDHLDLIEYAVYEYTK